MEKTLKTILSSFKEEKITYNNCSLIIGRSKNGINEESDTDITIEMGGEEMFSTFSSIYTDDTELEEEIKDMFQCSNDESDNNIKKLFYLSKNFGIGGLGDVLGIEKPNHSNHSNGKYDNVDFEQNPIAKALMMDSVYASTEDALISVSETNEKRTHKIFNIKDGECEIIFIMSYPGEWIIFSRTDEDCVKEMHEAQKEDNKAAVEAFFGKVKEMYKNGSEEIRRLFEIYGGFDLS